MRVQLETELFFGYKTKLIRNMKTLYKKTS